MVINNTDYGAHILVNVLIDLTNDNRLANNLTALIHNPLLDQAAQLKAEDMVRNGYFAHYSPTGVTPWHWFAQVGYYFIYAGENLAVNFTESKDVEDAWMKSPLHRANILDTRFKEIGLATSNGIYEGNSTTFVVQLFGAPSFADESKGKASSTSEVVTSDVSTKSSSNTKRVLASAPPLVAKKQADVKGESYTPPETKEENVDVSNPHIMPIFESQSVALAQNIDAQVAKDAEASQMVPTYSTWYERLMYKSPELVNTLYGIFIMIVVVALSLMIFIEIKRQHPKNILYGVLTLSTLFLFMYMNQEYFMRAIPFV